LVQDLISRVRHWWTGGTAPGVKLVCLVLLANGIPAFVILMSAPSHTDSLFVWTIHPSASARLLGVMYGNALLLVGIGLLQPDWGRARITLVVIAWFSVSATVVTFFNLAPFLKHPWFHLAYWLSMYLILVVAAPLVFFLQARASGGRLERAQPLRGTASLVATIAVLALGSLGIALFISTSAVSDVWPWALTPLVGRIVAVWFTALAAAYAWALWDGDWLRARPIFVEGLPTGILLALLPLLHRGDLKTGVGSDLALYLSLAGLLVVSGLVALVRGRTTEAADGP
jgi:hypothetical protein